MDNADADNVLEKLLQDKIKLTNEIRNSTGDIKMKLIEESKSIVQKIKLLTGPKDQKHAEKHTISKECQSCFKDFQTSSKNNVSQDNISQEPDEYQKKTRKHPGIVFCGPCRKIRGKDILELIEVKNGNVITHIFQDNQINDAEIMLENMTADIRLDLHKTLDTISTNTQFSLKKETSFCCVSYVGQLTTTRISAKDDIIQRIKTGQLSFGALVFKRGPHKDPIMANNFTVPGSKAWFNLHLKYTNCPLFVDDSEDHVLSVSSIGVKSIQLNSTETLINVVKEHVN